MKRTEHQFEYKLEENISKIHQELQNNADQVKVISYLT